MSDNNRCVCGHVVWHHVPGCNWVACGCGVFVVGPVEHDYGQTFHEGGTK